MVFQPKKVLLRNTADFHHFLTVQTSTRILSPSQDKNQMKFITIKKIPVSCYLAPIYNKIIKLNYRESIVQTRKEIIPVPSTNQVQTIQLQNHM